MGRWLKTDAFCWFKFRALFARNHYAIICDEHAYVSSVRSYKNGTEVLTIKPALTTEKGSSK